MSDINTGQEPDSASVGESGSPRGKDRSLRPTYRQARYVVVVFVGGSLGTLARYGLDASLPTPGGWPLPTLLINLSGAFLLGLLLEAVVRRGPNAKRSVLISLGAGTGFMGAFTTYSTLALEAVQLGVLRDYGGLILYLALSLFGGVLASAAGIWIASRHHRVFTRATASDAGNDVT